MLTFSPHSCTSSLSPARRQGGGILATLLHASFRPHPSACQPFLSQWQRCCRVVQASVGVPQSPSSDDDLLTWSLEETSDAAAWNSDAPAAEAAVDLPAVHKPRQRRQQTEPRLQKQHRQQQRQHDSQPKALQELGRQQVPKAAAATGGHKRRIQQQHPGSPPAATTAAVSQHTSSKTHANHARGQQGPGRHTAAKAPDTPDPYKEAQRRVRAVLAAADLANPAAAAEQLPATVNDFTIALQLLATAPRPANLAAYRQYEAAVQQLAAAVLDRYKGLLLRLLPQQPDKAVLPGQDHIVLELTAALASLPATKLATVAFSLGVLRLYDPQVVPAFEAASRQLLQRGAFKPNQLGQLVQGFVYLDHVLGPDWHRAFLDSTRPHLQSMQGPQLASLAVWLTTYSLYSCSSSSSHNTSGSSNIAVVGQEGLADGHRAGHAHAAGDARGSVVVSPHAVDVQPDPAWVQAYLAAAGTNAGSLKPLQLVQVLQAAAALHRGQQQQAGSISLAAGPGVPAEAGAAAQQGSPVSVDLGQSTETAKTKVGAQQQHCTTGPRNKQPSTSISKAPSPEAQSFAGDGGSSSISADASTWVLPLVAALHRQLPEFTMAHLAAALPVLVPLTQHPWPKHLLQPLLLQVKVLLPSSAGKDLVAVTQAAAHLAGRDALAADHDWCGAVVSQLHAQLPMLGPAELAGAVSSIALLKVKPYKAWVYALCQRLRVDGKAMDCEQVLAVLEGLAAVGIQLDPEVLHVFVLQIQRWMGALNGDELGRLVAALQRMYPRVLPGRTVQLLVEELQRRQQFLALQSSQQQLRFD